MYLIRITSLTVIFICIVNLLFAQVIADAGPDQTINCDFPVVTLGTDSTSMGPEYTYEWSIFGDSISNLPFVEVSNSGTYVLAVVNTLTNEVATDTVSVAVQIEFIGLAIFDSGDLTCENNIVTLEVFTELFFFEETATQWQTANGNIISDPNQNIIEVDEPGDYSVVVTNLSSGCTGTATINVVAEASIPTISIQPTGVLNCIDTTVTLNLFIDSSSNSQFAISWEGDGIVDLAANDITVDQPGFYTVTVVDLDNGCFDTSSIFVEQDTASFEILVPLIDSISCDTFALLDPKPVFEQLNFDTCIGFWQAQEGLTVDTFPIAIATQSGTYIFNKVDPTNGCLGKIIFDINIPNDVMADAGPDQTINCAKPRIILGENIIIVPGFGYEWTGPFGTSSGSLPTIEVFQPGIYTLTVVDLTTGCESSDEVLVDIDDGFVLDGEVFDVSCFGLADGRIEIFVAGGTPPYVFEMQDSIFQTNLPPGEYMVSVTDASGCMSVVTAIISEPPPLAVEFTINAENQIEAVATGGVGAYTYAWNVEANANIIENPINGTEYELTITDANGCTLTDTYIFVLDGVFSPSAKQISVSPNPTDGLLYLHLDTQSGQAISQLNIFDIQGNLMSLSNDADFTLDTTLDLSHFPAGAYILQVVMSGDLYYQKIIVF